MKPFRTGLAVLALACAAPPASAAPPPSAPLGAAQQVLPPANPAIDMTGYLRVAQRAARHRESHRLGEDDFIRFSREPGTIVLDARSQEKYAELHVKGALHLSFPDIAIGSLVRLIPDPQTRILIYCNNNFVNAPGPFPSKLPSASLNLSTFIALYNYGYRNVYELGPRLDIRDSRLVFEGSAAPDSTAR